MAVEILVGLWVNDDKLYQQYRDEMLPILQQYGGGFGYDFRIAEVLKSETDEPINRVFTICFDDEAARSSFFSDREYLKIKDEYYEPSVSAVTIISTYER